MYVSCQDCEGLFGSKAMLSGLEVHVRTKDSRILRGLQKRKMWVCSIIVVGDLLGLSMGTILSNFHMLGMVLCRIK